MKKVLLIAGIATALLSCTKENVKPTEPVRLTYKATCAHCLVIVTDRFSTKNFIVDGSLKYTIDQDTLSAVTLRLYTGALNLNVQSVQAIIENTAGKKAVLNTQMGFDSPKGVIDTAITLKLK